MEFTANRSSKAKGGSILETGETFFRHESAKGRDLGGFGSIPVQAILRKLIIDNL
jgi:hypothetical protein